jgi:endonuclease G
VADALSRLKAANAELERRDDSLREELRERRDSVSLTHESSGSEPAPELVLEGQRVDPQEFEEETIVLRTGRPVLAIMRNAARLTFTDPESKIWKQRLRTAAPHLVKAAQAVGRIEVEGHALAWLGTGWLVSPDVIVTNRHVASEFGRQRGTSFLFKQGLNGREMSAAIDFIEEIDRSDTLTFQIEEILHIENPEGPDLAFLRVMPVANQVLAAHLELSAMANENELVAVLGYPAHDSRIPDQQLMERIFGQVYDKKRLAPGLLTRVDRDTIAHDCSTLGGNSGSVVLSLQTGKAVGLHFAGRFLRTNLAVPSEVVAERLEQVSSGATRGRPAVRRREDRPERATSQASPARHVSTRISYVFPVRVTIEVGGAYVDSDQNAPGTYQRSNSLRGPTGDADEVSIEGVPEDYRDRQGYLEAFLGDTAVVPVPKPTQEHNDVLTFVVDDRTEQLLRYEHFSVLMSKSRRLCRFSAVNIDGKGSKSISRAAWRTDPRIPLWAQIRNECYGAPPKFSRGHMTRREDPVWGSDRSAAKGNADSMHVTNAVPQMQPFNAGIWLDLEDYALQNARQDDMKISVFTGPFLMNDDPDMFGVQIPLEFWKLIAFIHDETEQLCATGYTMSQRDFLSGNEFIFGMHKTAQRSIASIEECTGLSFGPLAELDPFEDVEGVAPELTDLRQIQFIKRR